MSASPNDVQDAEKQSVDELAEPHTADDAEPGQSPPSLCVTSPFVFRRAIFVSSAVPLLVLSRSLIGVLSDLHTPLI